MKHDSQNKNEDSTSVTSYAWSDDFSPEFHPSAQKMYALHKVPEFKKRFASD